MQSLRRAASCSNISTERCTMNATNSLVRRATTTIIPTTTIKFKCTLHRQTVNVLWIHIGMETASDRERGKWATSKVQMYCGRISRVKMKINIIFLSLSPFACPYTVWKCRTNTNSTQKRKHSNTHTHTSSTCTVRFRQKVRVYSTYLIEAVVMAW